MKIGFNSLLVRLKFEPAGLYEEVFTLHTLYIVTFLGTRANMWSNALRPMAATIQPPRAAALNRRRRVRQKVHAPAYATFLGAAKGQMLQLYEVLDISEIGVSLQCPSPLPENEQLELCLDLAEAHGQITTPARVIWSDSSGRVGLGFPSLRDGDIRRLQQWLFLNAIAGAANAAASGASPTPQLAAPSNYSDTLSAASAIQREAELLGPDLNGVLSLVAFRSISLFHAGGAAIALSENDPDTMICRASAGLSAPPVGATLRVGSGFSGDCVRTASISRCDDSETDPRVDSQICRALGVRSILAAPISSRQKVIGLIEIFGERPKAFGEKDGVVLQRLAETVSAAVKRAEPPVNPKTPEKPFVPAPGSVLFAHPPLESSPENSEKMDSQPQDGGLSALHFPRSHLYLLISAAAVVALALGFILAPWIQELLHHRGIQGSSNSITSPSTVQAATWNPSDPNHANSFDQLSELAQQGDAKAENSLGLLYAQGDEKQSVKQDEAEAANWFTKAAGHGSIPAQYKLGLMYWGGHGVPKDTNKAYFWTVLARAGGQEGSKDLAKILSNGMTRAQAAAIEQQAEMWYQQHELSKPQAGH